MNWKDYEIAITKHFRKLFPTANIQHDVNRLGVVSKIERQIDILIETEIASFPLTIIIDCKCFSKKVDVNDVDSFLSYLRDLKASKGVIITNIGYTDGALNRALNDTQDVELRIINFNDLEKYQGFLGIPYSYDHCAIVAAPEGWVLDTVPQQGRYLASFYPLGLTQAEAFHKDGFIYLVFSHKNKEWPNLDHLVKVQTENLKYKNPRINFPETIKRKDCKTLLRKIEANEFPGTIDYTLFLDFEEVIIFLVLLTPTAKADSYLKKLEWVGEKLIKGKVEHKNP